eukprot:gnl/MRDRNA2_/MRDRNA2_73236_c0_seq1.p1 gnl/MRDRNA2_/MRDRNA2_73236_c0~~gnl/MRDRNA2_/MRDRNA2_73236_c0_seq1.p1  ORF type:complete len:632 (+),score=130.55 gnl/MRDRNA2_/MRDRNA2_73236_c0_seq1:117-2012(+)
MSWKDSSWSDDKWQSESNGNGKETNDDWQWDDNSWNQDASWKEDDPWGSGKQEDAWADKENKSANSNSNSTGDGWNWDNKGDSNAAANAWSTGNSTASGQHYWDCQKWNKEQGTLSRKADWELEQDDQQLFTERLGSSAGIDFGKYDKIPVEISGSKAEHIPICHTFEEIYEKFKGWIPDALLQNVQRCQYKIPTPVQKYAIPCGLSGRDLMCCAQTGSGKTCAFLFPIIGRMIQHHDQPVGALTEVFEGECDPDTLILSPTRELCIQIYEEACKFTHRTNYRVTQLYGGNPARGQLEDIAKGSDLMVATPGRLADFLERKVVRVDKVNVLVLDEADRMLDMGFEPQVRAIVEQNGMPAKDERQTMMFSATFGKSCQELAGQFLYDYIWIGVGIVGGAVNTVDQTLVKVTPKDKYEKLIEVLDKFFEDRDKGKRCLIFVNAKDTAKWLDEQLYEKHIDTGALHGNLTQAEREKNLKRFRTGEIDVMVATDVAARGLDIENVSIVVNYDFPQDIDTYVHRIGRTGRIGNKGMSITFVAVQDWDTNTPLEQLEVLRSLLKVMKDAHSAIPDWLQPLIESAASGGGGDGKDSWGSWGGKDHRSGKENADWSNWKGNAASGSDGQDKAEDSWSSW